MASSSKTETKIPDDISQIYKELKQLRARVDAHEKAVIKLQRNDEISRKAISNLQNFFLGLFKKFLSKVTREPEESTNLLKWAGTKEVMCNNPDHLGRFSVKSITKYCGTDPTCPSCRSLEKGDQFTEKQIYSDFSCEDEYETF